MGRFFKKLRDIWSHEELRKRLGITLGFILIYRIGSFIVIPGVDSDTLQEQMSALGGGGLGDILSLFTGGAFSRASIFALGIMPYISASIIMQLMGLAVPSIQKMQSEERERTEEDQPVDPFPDHRHHVGPGPGLPRLLRGVRAGRRGKPDGVLVVQCRAHPDQLDAAHHVPR